MDEPRLSIPEEAEQQLKWPWRVRFIRHAESAFNELKRQKEADLEYQAFKEEFEKDPSSPLTRALAKSLRNRFKLGISDHGTLITSEGINQAIQTGKALKGSELPDVVIVSPYLRTQQTLENIIEGWPELGEVPVHTDLRLREQRHGLSLLYNDWRIFHVFHPEQRELYQLEGRYHYVYPQGDSVEDVIERILLWFGTLIREFAGEDVLVISHHMTILAIRAALERLTPEEFIDLDENHKPSNCGVTCYIGKPGIGRARRGRLELEYYNKVFY